MNQNLIEQFETRCGALRVADLVVPQRMDDKSIYRMAARGQIPSFRLGGAIRFDPQEIARWLRGQVRACDVGKPNASSPRGSILSAAANRRIKPSIARGR